MSIKPTKRLGTYTLTSRPMAPTDVPALHALSISVRWPHRPEDWAMLMQLGEGVVAEDEIGRVAGSAMWWPLGTDLASVGMVITTPRLQEHGAGRWLMEEIGRLAGDRDKVLNATRAAFHLYRSMGFTPGLTVYQHQGIAIASPLSGPVSASGPQQGSRPMTQADHAAIHALDAAALAADRGAALDALLASSKGTVVERDGQVTGYALCRRFGRGHVAGPVVAASEDDAIALIAPHVAAHSGSFLRIDTREPAGSFRNHIEKHGMALYDTVTTMSLGRDRTPAGPVHIFALASQALG